MLREGTHVAGAAGEQKKEVFPHGPKEGSTHEGEGSFGEGLLCVVFWLGLVEEVSFGSFQNDVILYMSSFLIDV